MTEKDKTGKLNAAAAGSVLQELLQEADFDRQLRRFSVFEHWPELVGSTLAAHSQPWRIREEVLEVRVDHGVWMQQLQLQKKEILHRINARLEDDAVRDLFWRFGPLHPSDENSSPPSEKTD